MGAACSGCCGKTETGEIDTRNLQHGNEMKERIARPSGATTQTKTHIGKQEGEMKHQDALTE